jgi:acyl-CoA synthetase (AMP-forming)/AMP-acid ligase II
MKGLVETFSCGVSNIYGITEGGGGGLFNLYPEDVLRKPGSIGKPTFGIEGKLVDFEGKEVPPGEVGELVFSTNRMMKGYFKNPEMTAETLKDGWLYTGDLLKTDEEGFFYIVDRKKDMITSGGENIFPVEIEDALMQSPKIDDVACIGHPDDQAGGNRHGHHPAQRRPDHDRRRGVRVLQGGEARQVQMAPQNRV